MIYMTYWDLLVNSVNPRPVIKEAEQKYNFASKEFINAFTKCAESIGAKDIRLQLKKLDANYKSRIDLSTGS